ncbi:MAG: ABC transporter permease [Candidatus Hydrogenedentales bacterium]|jgi:ABC-type transport system involved in multi-copper enzyme maturation permease subunit
MPTALLPIVALIRRELVSSLRQRRFYVLMALLVFVAILLVSAVMLAAPDGRLSPMMISNVSRTIFNFVAYLLAIGAIVVIPATSGSSIVSEREEETLDLLAMTSAKPWHVIAAKLVNSIGLYLLLIVALMPVAASSFFLVGLDTGLLWHVLFIVTATMLSCAAAGVLCSCLFTRPAVAVGTSYLCMLTILGLPLLLLLILLALFDVVRFQDSLAYFAVFVSPYLAFAINTIATSQYPTVSSVHAALVCSVLYSVLAIVLVVVAHRLVARRWGKSESTWSVRAGRKSPKAIRRVRRSYSFTKRGNPIYLKESGTFCRSYPLCTRPLRNGANHIDPIHEYGRERICRCVLGLAATPGSLASRVVHRRDGKPFHKGTRAVDIRRSTRDPPLPHGYRERKASRVVPGGDACIWVGAGRFRAAPSGPRDFETGDSAGPVHAH